MDELERRIEHNKKALAAVAAERKRMYSGIRSVEMDEDCLNGGAILAVSDNIFDRLPPKYQYTPHILGRGDASGKLVEEPVKQEFEQLLKPSEVTKDLNELL